MPPSDVSPSEETLARLLAGIDEQIAVGSPTNALKSAELTGEDAEELSWAERCLQMIDRVRSSSNLSSQEFLSTTTARDAKESWEDDAEDPTVTTPKQIGRYEVFRKLGCGGYGVVYLARDVELDRNVAIKLPLPTTLDSENTRVRFLREGKTAASLRHPNIVPIYDIGRIGPACYMVSAYCQGPSLAEWISSRNKPTDFVFAARLIRDLALAIGHAHEHNVIHRDLKPSNILLEHASREGRHEPTESSVAESVESQLVPMITDFGLAKELESENEQTQSGAMLGTPAYMSPEQAAGNIHQVGPAADIYSLGVILYELLTGQRPSEQATALATLRSIQLDDIVPPTQLRPDVPKMLDAICMKCLEKFPTDRYPTGSDLASDLDIFLANDPELAISKSARMPPGTAVRWKLPTIIAAIIAISAAVLVVIQQYDDRQNGVPHLAAPMHGSNPIASNRPTGDGSPDRRVAEFVLRHGNGRIHTTSGGRFLSSSTELSNKPFALTVVEISDVSQLDDSVIEDLTELPKCRSIAFYNTPLTNTQIEQLSRSEITNLIIYSTSVSDSGLVHLAQFPKLSHLHLADSDLTDRALLHVEKLQRLVQLTLTSNQLTNAGLVRLKRLKNLRELSLLRSSGIGDEGLKHLDDMTALKSLVLRQTSVTDQGVFALKTKMPECAITWDSQDPDIRAAFAILHAQGRIKVVVDTLNVAVAAPADFPAAPFVIQEIDLRDSRNVSDEVLELIRPLRGVQSFHLGPLQRRADRLTFLCELPNIQRLILHKVAVSESLIGCLGQLEHLTTLEFRNSKASKAQMSRIRERLPNCEVTWTQNAE